MRALQPQFKHKTIRSYVIRSGRITPSQEKALSEDWAIFGLDLHQGTDALTHAFSNPAHEFILEIGFGMGDSLLAMAEQYPEKNFIGIEVHVPGVGRLMSEARKRNLQNLRVFCADAIDVLHDCIADNSLARVQLYFPDPWHKSRHHKRRIVQPAFVNLVVQKLRIDGVLHMATDWEPYAEVMLEVASAHSQLTNMAGGAQYSARPDYRPETKFERRGENLGHVVHDLLFRKRARLCATAPPKADST
ncbi:MAG: tRNA (guanosine(46)-N7)-methyltransferase TrmB [Cellvibrionales bacterium]|jgi:tRNA (guanine-N7-)-methyltransferase|nr:tRNA (guanosine(46)-N7)-methyltransferase TrmB [Cellvibrionales bacterium]